MSSNSTVLGVLVLARHGDRTAFYQQPNTYAASETSITPLGEVQQFQLGGLVRSLYLQPASPSYIQGITPASSLLKSSELALLADAGDEGGVIYDSALAFTQGLWPSTTIANTTLANGTTIVSPLGGYQYIPIESVESAEDVSLEGWTSCPAFDAATADVYASDEFHQVSSANAGFLASLTSIVGNRPVTLQNMWNVFDFMNVQSIHNATFLATCPPATLAQARALANYHESTLFSSSNLSSIHNVPGQAILPVILGSLSRLANSSDPLKFQSVHISYKPFLSLLQMMGVAEANPSLAGIINYAGSSVFEVHSSNDGPVVRFKFKNGTDDATYSTYQLFGSSSDISLNDFQSHLEPYALTTLSSWCNACGNNSTRGCDLIATINSTSHIQTHHQPVSLVAAGFIGACVTIALFLALLALGAVLGFLHIGPRRSRNAVVKEAGAVKGPEKL